MSAVKSVTNSINVSNKMFNYLTFYDVPFQLLIVFRELRSCFCLCFYYSFAAFGIVLVLLVGGA